MSNREKKMYDIIKSGFKMAAGTNGAFSVLRHIAWFPLISEMHIYANLFYCCHISAQFYCSYLWTKFLLSRKCTGKSVSNLKINFLISHCAAYDREMYPHLSRFGCFPVQCSLQRWTCINEEYSDHWIGGQYGSSVEACAISYLGTEFESLQWNDEENVIWTCQRYSNQPHIKRC